MSLTQPNQIYMHNTALQSQLQRLHPFNRNTTRPSNNRNSPKMSEQPLVKNNLVRTVQDIESAFNIDTSNGGGGKLSSASSTNNETSMSSNASSSESDCETTRTEATPNENDDDFSRINNPDNVNTYPRGKFNYNGQQQQQQHLFGTLMSHNFTNSNYKSRNYNNMSQNGSKQQQYQRGAGNHHRHSSQSHQRHNSGHRRNSVSNNGFLFNSNSTQSLNSNSSENLLATVVNDERIKCDDSESAAVKTADKCENAANGTGVKEGSVSNGAPQKTYASIANSNIRQQQSGMLSSGGGSKQEKAKDELSGESGTRDSVASLEHQHHHHQYHHGHHYHQHANHAHHNHHQHHNHISHHNHHHQHHPHHSHYNGVNNKKQMNNNSNNRSSFSGANNSISQNGSPMLNKYGSSMQKSHNSRVSLKSINGYSTMNGSGSNVTLVDGKSDAN